MPHPRPRWAEGNADLSACPRLPPTYAAAGIPEVWLVDLTADRIEVYREPVGGAYRERRVLGREGTLTVLRLPGVTVSAGEIVG